MDDNVVVVCPVDIKNDFSGSAGACLFYSQDYFIDTKSLPLSALVEQETEHAYSISRESNGFVCEKITETYQEIVDYATKSDTFTISAQGNEPGARYVVISAFDKMVIYTENFATCQKLINRGNQDR